MDLHDCICDRIQEVDSSIRYVGLANKMGTRIEDHYRYGLCPLLKESELDLSVLESVLRMNLRYNMQYKLGKPLYSFTLYEKVKRVTFHYTIVAIKYLFHLTSMERTNMLSLKKYYHC